MWQHDVSVHRKSKFVKPDTSQKFGSWLFFHTVFLAVQILTQNWTFTRPTTLISTILWIKVFSKVLQTRNGSLQHRWGCGRRGVKLYKNCGGVWRSGERSQQIWEVCCWRFVASAIPLLISGSKQTFQQRVTTLKDACSMLWIKGFCGFWPTPATP